jgi:hypothetical protein
MEFNDLLTQQLVDDKAAAAFLGLKPPTLGSWRCRGVGPRFSKLGSGRNAAVRYHPLDLAAFVVQGRHVSPSSVRAA